MFDVGSHYHADFPEQSGLPDIQKKKEGNEKPDLSAKIATCIDHLKVENRPNGYKFEASLLKNSQSYSKEDVIDKTKEVFTHQVGVIQLTPKELSDIARANEKQIQNLFSSATKKEMEPKKATEIIQALDQAEQIFKVSFASQKEQASATFAATVNRLMGNEEELSLFLKSIPPNELGVLAHAYITNSYIRTKTYQTGLHGEEKRASHDALLGALFKNVESLNQYFYMHGKDGRALNYNGLSLIISHLKEKENSPLQNVDCRPFSNIEELSNALNSIDLNKNQQYEFLVRHAPSDHITPFHIQVKNGQMTIIVTDSVGAGIYRPRILLACKTLIENNPSLIKLHVCVSQRQADETRCPIFSLRDVMEFAKHPAWFDEIPTYSEQSEGQDLVDPNSPYLFTMLPLNLVKLTQGQNRYESLIAERKKKLESEKRSLKTNLSERQDYLELQKQNPDNANKVFFLQNLIDPLSIEIDRGTNIIHTLEKEIQVAESRLQLLLNRDISPGQPKIPTAGEQYKKYEALVIASTVRDALNSL